MEPIKLFSCLNVFGGDRFSMASVFLIRNFFPSLLTVNPNYSVCLHANLHLSNDIARFFLVQFFSELIATFVCVDPKILLLRLEYRPNRHRCSYNL